MVIWNIRPGCWTGYELLIGNVMNVSAFEQYTEEKLRQADPAWRLVLIFTPEPTRARLRVLLTLLQELQPYSQGDGQIAAIKLQWWRDELRAAFAGHPTHPVSQQLARLVQTQELQLEPFLELIDGVEMDLQHAGYDSLHDLALYTYRTGAVPAMLIAQVCGHGKPETLQAAQNLGTGMRLVALLRDAGRHAAQGRIYLPGELLRQQGVSTDDLNAPDSSPRLRTVCAQLAARADEHLQRGDAQLPAADRVAQLPLLLMAALAKRQLNMMQARDHAVLEQPVHLRPWQQLWLIWRTAGRETRRTYRSSQSPHQS
jgi:phytoene synthase